MIRYSSPIQSEVTKMFVIKSTSSVSAVSIQLLGGDNTIGFYEGALLERS